MSDRPTQAEHLEITEVEDGLVVYDPSSRRVHHLNATAVLVFELSNGTNTVEDMADVVQQVFGLDRLPIPEVQAAVEQMRSEGLLS